MNPDRTPDRQPDLRTPARSPEIIDVSVVAAEVASGSEPLDDAWDTNEAATQPPSGEPPVVAPHPPLNETPPAADPVTTSPPSEEDNWAMLLDEISQEVEPEPQRAESTAQSIEPPVGIDNLKVAPLLRAEAQIKAEIARLEATQAQLQQQIVATQTNFSQIIHTSISDLEQRQQKLQISVEQLERRRDRITAEINKSFAGGSQDIAIRLQGFKDYLVGSLQDLVVIAEEIEFPQPPPAQIRLQTPLPSTPTTPQPARNQTPQFAEPAFKATASKVKSAIDRYRNAPDYYAPTWQLRRTLEAVHANKVSEWFFAKDGRGAVRTMGSRLQNILVAAAAVSALRELYGDYLRTLVLANLPERLGDWRRGFQDCLGLSKTDFGGNGGIILFEDPEALIQKVDRIVANKEMPFIIIDNSEGQISLSILQYPLWLAFAPDPNQQVDDFREYR
jgi:flagellar hook-basal body complex protein FliE